MLEWKVSSDSRRKAEDTAIIFMMVGYTQDHIANILVSIFIIVSSGVHIGRDKTLEKIAATSFGKI